MGAGVGRADHRLPGAHHHGTQGHRTARFGAILDAIDEGIVMAADRYGKLKTVLQICAIIPLILNYPFFGINLHLIGLIFLYLSMFMALYSCYNYCRKFIFAFREIHAGETDGGGNGTGLN